MIALLALLLLTSPAWGQVTVQNVTVQNVTIGIAGTTSPNDWTGSMVALWRLEEASGTRANETDTTCGTGGCDLSDNATVTQNSSDPMEGSAAAFYVQTNSEYLSCTTDASNCDELEPTGGLMSIGCWGKPTATSTNRWIQSNTSANNGWDLWINTIDNVRCLIGDGSDTQFASLSSGLVEGEWGHFACTYGDDASVGDDTIRVYYNAGTPATQTQEAIGSSTTSFILGYTDSNTWDGSLDECFVVLDVVLSQAQIAHIAACGVDGSDCLCNGATYSTKGKVDSSCDGADNPWPCCTGTGTGCIDDALLTGDCNAAAP